MKPEGLIKCIIRPTRINAYVIRKLEVDLRHINFGLGLEKDYRHNARSAFSVEDVINAFESMDGTESVSKQDQGWEYFVVSKQFFGKKYKYRIVFCINLKQTDTAGVITLFRLRRKTNGLP